MSASFSQRFLHWLEMGGGSHLVVRFAIALVAAAFLSYSGWQRFQGPDDRTMEQALVARELAEGRGYSTPIIWPQSLAVLRESGYVGEDWKPDPAAPLPELHQAPGYPTLIGGAMKLMGEGGRSWLFAPTSMESAKVSQPYRADVLMLALNIACALGVALGAGLLAEKLFNPWAGAITLAGVMTSLALGESLAAVDGTLWLAFLAILLAWSWEGLVRAGLENRLRAACLWSLGGALALAALYLSEYAAGLLLFPWLFSAAWATAGRGRWAVVAVGLGVFLLSVAPWTLRNISLTGHPMALAGQSFALKSGDATADPLLFKNTDSSVFPDISVRKVMNKGLKGVETTFSTSIWSGGAQLLSAFAVASLLYRFRQTRTSQLRWGWLMAWGLTVVGQSFVASGESPRVAAIWLSPWLMILGAGFFMILLESLRRPTPVMRATFAGGVVVLNGLPILHHLTEPKGFPFRISNELPGRMALMGTISGQELMSGYHYVTDAPASLAWYGRLTTWSLPSSYRSLTDLHRRHFLAGLLLTPRSLEQSLYTKLLPQARFEAELDRPGVPFAEVTGWAPVWSEIFRQVLAQGKENVKLPRDFPFDRMYLLPEVGLGRTVIFFNPLAQRARKDGR